MSESEFGALRDLLEARARQPGFDAIRARRRKRVRSRLAIATVTVLTLVVAVGTVLVLGGTRPTPPPPATPAPTLDGPSVDVEGLTAAADGTLYLQVTACALGDTACRRAAAGRSGLLVSADLGTSWTSLGAAPVAGRLLDTSPVLVDGHRIWIAGHLDTPDPRSNTGTWVGALSVDNGQSWRTWSHEEAVNLNSFLRGSTAGGTAWFAAGRHVYAAVGDAEPTLTAAQPEGFNNIYQLTALGPRHALLMGVANNQSPVQWLETIDGGGHWTPATDPCADTPAAGTLYPVVTRSPDGALWTICTAVPAVDAQPTAPVDPTRTRYVLVSTDQGHSWQERGTFTEPVSGLLTLFRAVSDTVAWRYTLGGDLMRTVDGRVWTVADHLSPEDRVSQLAVVDATTAITVISTMPDKTAAGPFPTITVRLRITHDGGQTWSTQPLP